MAQITEVAGILLISRHGCIRRSIAYVAVSLIVAEEEELVLNSGSTKCAAIVVESGFGLTESRLRECDLSV
jgi:hypothetical protein